MINRPSIWAKSEDKQETAHQDVEDAQSTHQRTGAMFCHFGLRSVNPQDGHSSFNVILQNIILNVDIVCSPILPSKYMNYFKN